MVTLKINYEYEIEFEWSIRNYTSQKNVVWNLVRGRVIGFMLIVQANGPYHILWHSH